VQLAYDSCTTDTICSCCTVAALSVSNILSSLLQTLPQPLLGRLSDRLRKDLFDRIGLRVGAKVRARIRPLCTLVDGFAAAAGVAATTTFLCCW
jgi:hypothetical protein